MLFSGIPFLYLFLPLVLILYFIAPTKLKNFVLMLSSVFFYAWGERKYVIMLLLSVLFGYVFGLLIEKTRGKAASRLFLVLSVIQNLGFLCYFKYADFFIENFNAATGLSVPLLGVVLPIGISFYTFQILSYTVDVYRGDVAAQKNFVTLAAYITMFPQLIAGPIVRYSDVALQLGERTHSFEKAAVGIRRFVFGLAKKVLLANRLGEFCDIFRASDEQSVIFYWVYGIAYMLHIYFDFSGYSDMAIGLGKVFGFDFIENFNYPFISKSATEFWRRWHMSLGTWFRDYVYIPMGGNRVSFLRHVFNILTVWMLTGFWHGAEWNFVIWGLYFAIVLMLEKAFLLKLLKNSKVISRIYALVIVLISFLIFNATKLSMAWTDIRSIFGFGGLPLFSHETAVYLRGYGLTLIISAFAATPVAAHCLSKLRGKAAAAVSVCECFVLPAMFIICTAYLVDGSFNPFLYFRF
ncbi:MAG: MBOAT family protein [Clostridia bacterium]|nr:MBOAT family protein [Clostridia bacterium]